MANLCFNGSQKAEMPMDYRLRMTDEQESWDAIERVKDEEWYRLLFTESPTAPGKSAPDARLVKEKEGRKANA